MVLQKAYLLAALNILHNINNMKKLLLSSLIIASIAVFAYTQTDVDNSTYLAGKWIITSQSTTAGYRLDDTITRAEVAGIALKLRGTTLPEGYICKRYFWDVIRNDWVCRAVELATDAGIVSRTNRVFRSQERITRAEALSMIVRASKISLQEPRRITQSDGTIWSLYSDVKNLGFTQWQADLLDSISDCKIFNKWVSCEDGADTNIAIKNFKPNSFATRAEVFGFAKNILEYKAMMSGEVTVQ